MSRTAPTRRAALESELNRLLAEGHADNIGRGRIARARQRLARKREIRRELRRLEADETCARCGSPVSEALQTSGSLAMFGPLGCTRARCSFAEMLDATEGER